MKFTERLAHGVIVFDGAMGTQIHQLQPNEQDYQGKSGCIEILNLTLPQQIQQIHERYLAAGADVIETNSFGANPVVLSEYDLADQTELINNAAVAIAARARAKFSDRPRFIAGSIGPGTKLPSLGHISYDQLYTSYWRQAQAMAQSGVDLFMVETCQDPLQIKACLNAIADAQQLAGTDLPVIVSVTVETSGTLLVGTEISAVITIIRPFAVTALGMNCATGPEAMRPYLKQICSQFPGPVLVMPNAGLPENVGGEMVYTMDKQQFAAQLVNFIVQEGVQLVGGCCGTTPEFIATLYQHTRGIKPAARTPQTLPALASLFSAQSICQQPAPMFIGERANTNGSKQFRKYLLKEDWDGVVAVAQSQQRTGAHALDLCVAYSGRDELADMQAAVSRVARQVILPLVVDSTEIAVLESALKLYGGRAAINSINLENGEERAARICRLARRYGAAVIALTIDEKGMAMTVEHKLAIAERIYRLAVQDQGLAPEDLLFDPLTFTLGSGDVGLRDAGRNTLEALRCIKERLPGVHTTLGISNISFGLAPAAREVLNSVFLAEAVKAGLDTAIVHVNKIIPLYRIPAADRRLAEELIYNCGDADSLFAFIRHFEKRKEGGAREASAPIRSDAERIRQKIIQGNRSGLVELLQQKLTTMPALEIIDAILIAAMKEVGELFAAGEMQLPFVLQAAEVMKFAVDCLQPYIDKDQAQRATTLVIATVRGDVHDIGKNLVDIILSNNGYKVYNLGIKCEIGALLDKVQQVQADAIGLSGLLVKSTLVMKENLEEMRRRGIDIPVLLGGAALTRSYVDEVCAPILNSPIIYCADAFDGLKAMKHIDAGTIDDYAAAVAEKHRRVGCRAQPLSPDQPQEEIRRDIAIPVPPFWGDKLVSTIDLAEVYGYLSEELLFGTRWGYQRRQFSVQEYQELIDNQVRRQFAEWKEYCQQQQLLQPQVVYGYYPCNSEDQYLVIYHWQTDNELARLKFPRQLKPPHRCIADYFLPTGSERRDVIALQLVSIGARASEYAAELFANDRYKDYLLFHGLAVETTEALAEYWQQRVRAELGIDAAGDQYRGRRYSFGYPACPDLQGNHTLFTLLQPQRIGVTINQIGQMVPEQTTCAFIVHQPQAR